MKKTATTKKHNDDNQAKTKVNYDNELCVLSEF